jgi:tRNA threonylcarbamoyladenosine biosynthesis protein TsaB
MTSESPLILAIETSSAAGSTALLRGGELLAEQRFDPAMRGGTLLYPGVESVLAAARGASPDLVAVGIGPGSYTGARIGVVFAKTYAFARGTPLVGVSALEAVAARVMPKGRSAPMLAAHPGHAYAAVYEGQGDGLLAVVREPALVSREAFLASLDGAVAIEMPPEQAWAADVGRVAWRRAASGLSVSQAGALEPLYLQAPSPERVAAKGAS